MHVQIPIVFNIRGHKREIIPELFQIILSQKKKKVFYQKKMEELEIETEDDDENNNISIINNNYGKPKLNLREYYGNYDINEYKEIYGIISTVLTKKIKKIKGINKRFSINVLLNKIAKKYGEDVNNIAPLLPKNNSKTKKPSSNLCSLLYEKPELDNSIKGSYSNHIIPISILPLLFDEIAVFLGPGRLDNDLFVNQIFDDFNNDYIRSQINDYNIDNRMMDMQIDVMNENNLFLKRLYQKFAFKYIATLKQGERRVKDIKQERKKHDEIKKKRLSSEDHKKKKNHKRKRSSLSEDLLKDNKRRKISTKDDFSEDLLEEL